MLPQLATEREHLARADIDIAAGERRVGEQRLLIERLRKSGYETKEAEKLLAILQDTLDTWNAHRKQILGEIARLEQKP